ncbi:unnamed protein product [Toxocara canis]|uniref:Peptidase A2 domain-containing protein n=1 Tax=Toxocara canis TaxID=6265 RepID=A0A183V0R6_TOXCA|nr:unnamed protein product [Toxocara canis]
MGGQQASTVSMYSEALRVILDTQEERQQQTLKATLEPTRLPKSTYDLDNGCGFDVWFSRYDDVIANDGSTLDEVARDRLIVWKLTQLTLAAPNEKSFRAVLRRHREDAERAVWTPRCNGEAFSDYIGMLNRRHEMAEFNTTTVEQMKPPVCICDSHTSTRAHSEDPAVPNIRQDPEVTGCPQPLIQPEVNVNELLLSRRTIHGNPSSGFRCEEWYWGKECKFINKMCNDGKLIGHKKGYCKNFAMNEKRISKKKRRTTNNVIVTASKGTDVAPLSRVHKNVQIDGAIIQTRLDTGAVVTLLTSKCDIDVDGHKGKGDCHVVDNQPLLGLDWIAQNESVFRRITETNIHRVSAAAVAKDPIKAELNSSPKPTAPWNWVHADFASLSMERTSRRRRGCILETGPKSSR